VNIGLLKFDRGKISLPCENSAGWAAGKISTSLKSTSLKIHNHQRVKIAPISVHTGRILPVSV